jgi:hypothetical protein
MLEEGSSLVQIDTKGPFDRDTNPFEQFRTGGTGMEIDGPEPFTGRKVVNGSTSTTRTVTKGSEVITTTSTVTSRNVTTHGSY